MKVKWILLSGVDHFPLSDGKSFSWRRTGTAKNAKWQSNLLVTFIKSLDRRKLPVNKSLHVCFMGPVPNSDSIKSNYKPLFPSKSRSEPLFKQKDYLWSNFVSLYFMVYFLTRTFSQHASCYRLKEALYMFNTLAIYKVFWPEENLILNGLARLGSLFVY